MGVLGFRVLGVLGFRVLGVLGFRVLGFWGLGGSCSRVSYEVGSGPAGICPGLCACNGHTFLKRRRQSHSATLNPEPETLNLKPKTLNPKP